MAWSALRRFARATDGANVVEYIILVGCIALLALVGYRRFGQSVSATTSNLGNNVMALRETHPPDVAPGPGTQCTGGVCTNGSNCFAAGTLVSTPEGLQPIEQIKAGDLVVSADPETGAVVSSRVAGTFVTPDHVVFDVTFRASPRPIRVTRGHLWFTLDRGWIPTEELEPSEPLLRADGAIERVDDVLDVDAHETVYNFEVERTHTYFVGEARVLVHNPNFRPGGNRIDVRMPGGGRSQGLVVGNGPNGTYTVEVTTSLNGGPPVQGQPTTTTTMNVDKKGRVVSTVPPAGPGVTPYTGPLATGGTIDDGHGQHQLPVHPPRPPSGDPQTAHLDGSIQVGNHIIVLNPSNAPPGFQQAVLDQLNTLNSTPTGQQLLQNIDQSGHDVRIGFGDGYNTRPQTNPDQPQGYRPGNATSSGVVYNPFMNGMAVEPPWAGPQRHDISDGVLGPMLSGQGGSGMWAANKPPYITLGHEFTHAAHFGNGTTDFGSAQSVAGENVPVSGYEYQATGLGSHAGDAVTENQIRQDFNLPPRPFYGEQTELPHSPPAPGGLNPAYVPPPSFWGSLNCFGGGN